MRRRATKSEMQDLEGHTADLVAALRDDGQADLAARVAACQVARLTRHTTGVGWGLCHTPACPVCRRWAVQRWCRWAAGKLGGAGACSAVRIDLGRVEMPALHDAVRRWRTHARNLRHRQAHRVGGRRWAEMAAVGAVEVAQLGDADGLSRWLRVRAVLRHPGTDWQAVRDAVGGQWAGAVVTPAADVPGALAEAVEWLHGARDVPLFGLLHATGRGLRPLACVMQPIGRLAARAAAEVVQDQDGADPEDHYAFVL